MKNTSIYILTIISFILLYGFNAYSHCEIPCGIYDDELRINLIKEHIITIEKSMKQIKALEKNTHRHSNQLIRWVMNKEHHANELQEIVTQYFMTQRIKPDSRDYEKKLGTLHQMLLYAMKCKQTTEKGHVKKLKTLVEDFQSLYFRSK